MYLDKISEDEKLQTNTAIKIISKETTETQNPTNFSNIQIEKVENPSMIKKERPNNTFIEIQEKNNISKPIEIEKEVDENIKNDENVQYEMIPGIEQNMIGFQFAKDNLNDIVDESPENKENQNIIIKTTYKIENQLDDNNKKNTQNTKKEVYRKNIINKGNAFNKKINSRNENTNQVISQIIEKKTIIDPSENIKQFNFEKNDSKKNIEFHISKQINAEDSNDEDSDFGSEYFDACMGQRRIDRYKSFASHNSFSKDQLDDLFSSNDFRIQRTKTITNFIVSNFSEKDEEEDKEETDDKCTNIKYLVNNIPILKENEFKELNPIIEKFDKSYSESLTFNKQDSKEEITEYKNEIVTTTRKEKKIIDFSGKIIEKLNITDSMNSLSSANDNMAESIEINKNININNDNNNENENLKYKLTNEKKFIDKIELWEYFVKLLISRHNSRFKEYNRIFLDAITKKYKKVRKINIRLNKKDNEEENDISNKEKELKENISNLEIKEKREPSFSDSDKKVKRKKK